MSNIIYDRGGFVLIGDEYSDTLENFIKDCEAIGFDNPFEDGQACMFSLEQGKMCVSAEGDCSDYDGASHPELKAFVVKKHMVLKAQQDRADALKVIEDARLSALSAKIAAETKEPTV